MDGQPLASNVVTSVAQAPADKKPSNPETPGKAAGAGGGGNGTPPPVQPAVTGSAPITPGWKTSEGQITAVVTFLQALLAVYLAFKPDKLSPEQQKALAQIIPVTLTLTAGLYAFARAHVKASALKSQ